MVEHEEAIVPFPVQRELVPLGTEFRSTWLGASLTGLRERGQLERYLANLPREFHEPVLHSIAGVWLPAKVAVAHYAAIDALDPSLSEQVEWGRQITRRLEKTIFSLGFRAAREAGVTPWQVLRMIPGVYSREWRGGGACAVFRVGPKDARVEFAGFPCAVSPTCRRGMRGVLSAMSELVCTKAYTQEIPSLCSPTTLGYRVAWA